jgi:cyclic pyranopterin phosphate synthase
VIQSVSKPFCAGCTRARLSADGKLFLCLFARHGEDLRALLRGGAGEQDLDRRLRQLWERREDRYSAERAHARSLEGARERREAPGEVLAPKVEMSYIGG